MDGVVHLGVVANVGDDTNVAIHIVPFSDIEEIEEAAVSVLI